MKKALLIFGLVVGVSLSVVAIGYFFYSQIEYVDLIGKRVTISDNDTELLVIDDEEKVVFNYSISEWRDTARREWSNFFEEPLKINETDIGPEFFTRFTTVSPFPEGTKRLGFSVSTYAIEKDISLFFVMDISTGELDLVGKPNYGVVGNIAWSPTEVHFVYFLNTELAPGEYLTVDNAQTLEKEFTLSGEDILSFLEIEEQDYSPEFRSISWVDEGKRISFTTSIPGEEEGIIEWNIKADGSDLKRRE